MFNNPEIKKPSDLFGGKRGLVDSGLPPVAFVLVNLWQGLTPAVWTALAVGTVLFVERLARRAPVRHAVSGFLGVAIAAGIAKATGEARNYFVPGIVINLVYGLVCLGSAFTAHPIIGLLLKQFSDKPADWHEHPVVRRAYRDVTLGWAAVFLTRAIVQEYLRGQGKTGLLAVAKLAMGYPLYIAAIALTMPFINRRTRGVVVADDPHPEEPALPESPFEEVHHHADDEVAAPRD